MYVVCFLIIAILLVILLFKTWNTKKEKLHLLDKIELTFYAVFLALSLIAAANAYILTFFG